VVSRAPDGSRVYAKVDPAAAEVIDFLTNGRAEPVGSAGVTARSGDALHWRPAR
jgi:hypothetical protein